MSATGPSLWRPWHPTREEEIMDALTGKAVLVVDDSRAMRRLVGGVLTAFGADVLAAANGAEALDLFQRHGADAVVTDLAMGPMDGVALTSALRDAGSRDPRVPIVMMTGHWHPEREEAARWAGVDDLLLKPIVPAVLLRHLTAALSRQPLAISA